MGLDISVKNNRGKEVFNERLSNVGHSARMLRRLEPHRMEFPIVVNQVLYSSSHFGDEIPIDQLHDLLHECRNIAQLATETDDRDVADLHDMARTLIAACNAAIAHNNSIEFC